MRESHSIGPSVSMSQKHALHSVPMVLVSFVSINRIAMTLAWILSPRMKEGGEVITVRCTSVFIVSPVAADDMVAQEVQLEALRMSPAGNKTPQPNPNYDVVA